MCNCDNEKFGFDCTCEHEEKFPGNKEYFCEFCGMYTASQAKCNKCEKDS